MKQRLVIIIEKEKTEGGVISTRIDLVGDEKLYSIMKREVLEELLKETRE